jgi:hypothetical protein
MNSKFSSFFERVIYFCLLFLSSFLFCFFREKAERANDPNVEYIDVNDFK